ncbi:helix-turn-helix domain-containing protein [Aestuariibacter sp. GS-14]|uniref:AraC family transcriptional regulator n=1 Tax=Aestuariibacter sp. GS-14 TaxID=2590670 RepID=UPI00112C7FF7|nr:AraC family transcriptional regulator ligand-binding domain-containing protein [Aestuariibacter sp. GS-14]TPV53898.1 helix-turn-helix domain-containing protein [Aestuariibacter sp. GS-14]
MMHRLCSGSGFAPLLTLNDKVLPGRQIAASLVSVAVARGAPEYKILRGTGIFADDLVSNNALSCRQIQKLAANAQQYAKGYDVSFRFGQQLVTGHMHDVLPYFLHARHFGQCIRALPVLQTLVSPFVSAQRYQDDVNEYYLLQDAMGSGKQFVFMVEAYCAALVALAKLCTGKRLPFHFDFPFGRPRHIQEYEAHLGFRLKFNQPMFAIRIEKSALRVPCLQASSMLNAYARHRLLRQRIYRMGLLDNVRSLLNANAALTLPEAASQLALSSSSLKRKLAEHHTSFTELHDSIRRQQAIFYLQVQKLNNEQSALKMAFTDITNFRRAVKRWTGLTPSELRQV